jgi:N-acetylglutamate synthase-like GNAT family acetyltransferase
MIGWLWRSFFGRSDEIDLDLAQGRMGSAQIRVYSPGDFDACRELYILNEPGRFPPGHLPKFETALRSGSLLFLVVERDGAICGCGGIGMRTEVHFRAVLCFGLIHPKYQGQGFGTTLLLARLAALPEGDWIVTLLPVPASQGFYKRFNFRQFGYYELPAGVRQPVDYVRLSPDARSQCEGLLATAGVKLGLGSATVPVTEK